MTSTIILTHQQCVPGTTAASPGTHIDLNGTVAQPSTNGNFTIVPGTVNGAFPPHIRIDVGGTYRISSNITFSPGNSPGVTRTIRTEVGGPFLVTLNVARNEIARGQQVVSSTAEINTVPANTNGVLQVTLSAGNTLTFHALHNELGATIPINHVQHGTIYISRLA